MIWQLLLTVVFLSGCGPANYSSLFETEPTEAEFQLFAKEVDQILNNHMQFAIKIKNVPIRGGDDLEGNPDAFSGEIQRIFSLDVFSNYEKFKGFWPRLWKEKGADYRNRYLQEQAKVAFGFQPGDIKTPLSFMMNPLYAVRLFFENEELHTFAETLPQYSKNVEWDGVRERYIYQNFTDHLRIIALSGAIMDASYREEFKSYLESKPEVLKKFRANTKTNEAHTKYEPIDLLQTIIANVYINTYSFQNDGSTALTPIVVLKLAHKSLYHFFGSQKEDDYRGWELDTFLIVKDLDSVDKFYAFCADGGKSDFFTDQQKTDRGQSRMFIKHEEYEIFELIERNQDEIELECNGKIHTINLVARQGEKIPLPAKYELNQYRGVDPYRVVIPFALTEEIDKKARWIFHRYMNYYGFKYHGERQGAPTKKYFAFKSATADMIIPVAHSLNVNSFHLGTDRSVITRYTKTFKRKDGSRVPVELEVFFPYKDQKGKFERAVIDTDDLAKILHYRRQIKNTPLMIFNNSCYAQNSLYTWMKAYRKSAELSKEAGIIASFADLEDVPHVIAPKGGFPTATPIDVLSNVVFPFVAIEGLAMGQSPADVYKELQEPDLLKRDRIIRFLLKVQSWRKKEDYEDTKYDPVYNANFKDLFEANGYRLLLNIEGQSEVIEY